MSQMWVEDRKKCCRRETDVMFSQEIKLPRKVVREEVEKLHMFVWSRLGGQQGGAVASS
jgi:hypothetical protein